MDDIIARSHSRSTGFGIEHDLLFPKRILSEEKFSVLLEKNRKLVKATLPFIEDLYDIVKGSGFVIILTDGNGCILNLVGDKETVRDATVLNMVPGAYMAEDSVGTNAMGIAIMENRPIQVTAQEHFLNAYYRWTCSSAPIHDNDGKVIGVLNLTGKSNLVHPHTLGLVVAAVKSIEHQLKNSVLNAELNETSSYLDAIINSMSFAIFSVDTDGIIKRVNNTACYLFGIDKKDILNKNISNYLGKWDVIWRTISRSEKMLDEEVSVENIPLKGTYMMNAMPIVMDDFNVHGCVLTFRDMKRVYKIVSKYTGMSAHYVFDDIIGRSSSLLSVVDFAKQVANSPSTILITGESGTGKEVFAQAIHNASSRHDAGFVAVNCGAIPETLFESELFGYEDGAFTGAKKGGRPGKFELANGGTLFLDEVGEMPLEMQVKLLRALQEGEITRVGGSSPIKLDVRIIAATNKDLKELVDQNKFRLDLYYRLSVIPLKIPALRERREDIPLLIKYFMNLKAIKLNKDVPNLEPETYQMLLRYDWPGNIRELENFIEKTINLNGKILLDVKDEQEFRIKYLYKPVKDTERVSLKSLSEIERDTIRKTMDLCKGNMSKVARILGISRNTLYLKCKKYDIEYK
ncbi:MAG TPA: sigma 54-interacting transcriptional regulator [Tenuifilaceae bacterium]|nr:sigma 54-interacting transcriptional regulator [Tenuifilaceae bacterium]